MACPWELPFPLFPWLGSEVTGLELGWWSRQQPLTWRVETWNVHTERVAGRKGLFLQLVSALFLQLVLSCYSGSQSRGAAESIHLAVAQRLVSKDWHPRLAAHSTGAHCCQESSSAWLAKADLSGGGQLPGLEQRCHWEWGISICGCHMLSFSCEGKELYLQGRGTRSADKLSFLWWCWHGCVLRVWCWSFRRIYIQVLSLKTTHQMESLLWLLLFHSILQSVTARGVRFGLV